MAVKPKLALIPSGVKASKLYSVLPSDGVGDFDFSRSGSATRINKDGLIETVASNVPRLNYPLIDGVVQGCPSLLLEPSRTNLITYSEDFSQWTQTRTTNTDNEIISPNGTLNASLITEDTTLNTKFTFLNSSTTTNEHTLSFFAKYKGRYLQVLFGTSDTSGDVYINFDLQNGTFNNNGVSNPYIQDFGNGWYKISLSITPIVTSDFGVLFSTIPSLTSSRLTSYQGDGTSGVYIWGAQLEQGSYPTSYIPSLTGSQTTRSAETCNNSGNANTFNDSEGVFMAELLWTATSSNIYISIDDGTSSNRILIYSTSTTAIQALVVSGGSTQVAFTANNQDPTTFSKVAIKYKENDFQLWINGIKLLTDTVGSTPIGLDTLGFRAGGGINPLHGSVKQIQYFDTALTDTDLEELTSWTSFNEMATAQLYTIE